MFSLRLKSHFIGRSSSPLKKIFSPTFSSSPVYKVPFQSTFGGVRFYMGKKPFRRQLYEFFYEYPRYFWEKFQTFRSSSNTNEEENVKRFLNWITYKGGSYEKFRDEFRKEQGWSKEWDGFEFNQYFRNPRPNVQRVILFFQDVFYKPIIFRIIKWFVLLYIFPRWLYQKFIHNPYVNGPDDFPEGPLKDKVFNGPRETAYLARKEARLSGQTVEIPSEAPSFSLTDEERKIQTQFTLIGQKEKAIPPEFLVQICDDIGMAVIADSQELKDKMGEIFNYDDLSKFHIQDYGGVIITPLLGSKQHGVLNITFVRSRQYVFEVSEVFVDLTVSGERIKFTVPDDIKEVDFKPMIDPSAAEREEERLREEGKLPPEEEI